MPDETKKDAMTLTSAIGNQLIGSPLRKRRDVGRLPAFTGPNVDKFIAANPNSVRSAKKLGKRGWARLASRFIRENLPKGG